MDELKSVLKETLDGIKLAAGPRLYRKFLKVMDHAAKGILNSLDQISQTIWSLGTGEKNFAAVTADTELAMQLALLLGYEKSPIAEFDDGSLIMLDPRGSSQTLMAFHLLAEEELAAIPFGGLSEIQTIHDIQSLMAYLGHHFYLSFELVLLTTPDEMLPLFEDEVRESAECVEFICDRIGVMKRGSESRASWMKAKDLAFRQLNSIGQRLPVFRMKDIMNEVGEKLTMELAARCPDSTVHMFLHLHMIRMTVAVTGSNDTLLEQNINSYVTSFYRMPDKCLSERYMATASVVQGLLLKSLSETLSDDEIRTVYRQSVWQSLHFIDHFKISEREKMTGASPFVVVRPPTDGYVLGGNERDDERESEKTDVPERLKKDDEAEEAESKSLNESMSEQCSDINVAPESHTSMESDDQMTEELRKLDDDIQDLVDAVSNPQLPQIVAVELESVLEQKQTVRERLLQSLQSRLLNGGAPKETVSQSSTLDSQTLTRCLVMTLRHVRPVISSLCQVIRVTLPFLPRSQLCVVCEHLDIHGSATSSDKHLIDEIEQRIDTLMFISSALP